jgi:hypothetical protein
MFLLTDFIVHLELLGKKRTALRIFADVLTFRHEYLHRILKNAITVGRAAIFFLRDLYHRLPS